MNNRIIKFNQEFFNNINLPENLIKFMMVNSLSKELKKKDFSFSIEITFLGQQEAYNNELYNFNNKFNEFYVREVYLLIKHIKVVRARSICYLNSKYWIDLLKSNNSLGYYLFNDNNISRSEITFFYLFSGCNLLRDISEYKKIICRKSSFIMNYNIEDKLLLTECFLLDALKKFYK